MKSIWSPTFNWQPFFPNMGQLCWHNIWLGALHLHKTPLTDTSENGVSSYSVSYLASVTLRRERSGSGLCWVSSGLLFAVQVLFGVHYEAVILSVMLVEMMSEPTCVLKESGRPQRVCTYSVFVLGVSLISFFMFSSNDSTAERILGVGATKKEHEEGTAVSRKGRSEARTNKREVITASTC